MKFIFLNLEFYFLLIYKTINKCNYIWEGAHMEEEMSPYWLTLCGRRGQQVTLDRDSAASITGIVITVGIVGCILVTGEAHDQRNAFVALKDIRGIIWDTIG